MELTPLGTHPMFAGVVFVHDNPKAATGLHGSLPFTILGQPVLAFHDCPPVAKKKSKRASRCDDVTFAAATGSCRAARRAQTAVHTSTPAAEFQSSQPQAEARDSELKHNQIMGVRGEGRRTLGRGRKVASSR